MTPVERPEGAIDSEPSGRGRMARLRVVAVVTAIVLVADILVLKFVVPWADDEFPNPFMSTGYIVTFFLVFLNFVTAFAMVAYIFQGDSYPSDRWR